MTPTMSALDGASEDKPDRELDTNHWKSVIRAAVHHVQAWTEDGTGSPRIEAKPAIPGPAYQPITRVIVTDEVTRTLFDEYGSHRRTDRGGEEIGWQLLGLRDIDSVTVLATLPAGVERDAGEEHIRFNTDAQAIGYRILYPIEPRLTVLGIVHTHPGRLRHPSRGDLRGDSEWVTRLRGQEGVFGIGTQTETAAAATALHPTPNVQLYQGLRFDWYGLAHGEQQYRPLPVEITLGPDLAKNLRKVWSAIEAHATPLDSLARQLAKLRFELGQGEEESSLMLVVPLPHANQRIRVQMIGAKQVRYFFETGQEIFQAELPVAMGPDQGVYTMLAELAARQ